MPALNPPPAMNNILGLAASLAPMGRGDAGYADTGEPTASNSTAPGTIVKTATFPLNNVGTQPQVARGAWALLVKSVAGTATVGAITIAATDGTVIEQLASFPALSTAGQGCCYVENFASSLAAGVDKGAITNVVSLTATVALTGTSTAVIMFAAVGSP